MVEVATNHNILPNWLIQLLYTNNMGKETEQFPLQIVNNVYVFVIDGDLCCGSK